MWAVVISLLWIAKVAASRSASQSCYGKRETMRVNEKVGSEKTATAGGTPLSYKPRLK